jgi:type II secretory pathway pseudopilin PulG
MGQQQLLLIILGVIVVGIAVAVGITMFTDNAQSANRDAVTNDLVNLASRAQQHYRRPAALGGGQGAFDDSKGGRLLDITMLTSKPVNANGTYNNPLPVVSADNVVLVGTGTETGFDGTLPVRVEMTVWADSSKITGTTN